MPKQTERVYHCYECGYEIKTGDKECPDHPTAEMVPMDKITSGDEVIYQQVYAPQ